MIMEYHCLIPPLITPDAAGYFMLSSHDYPGAAMSVEELEKEALKLPVEERERLAMSILSSLRGELKYEAEWAREAERRAREIDEGRVETIPADRVFREALDRLE
jgi:putative addiction module component (TIGR02574 family)